MLLHRIHRIAAVVYFGITGLVLSAPAQITVTSPTNGATNLSAPVHLNAQVSSCNGSSNITAFGYSINSSPFITWANENSAGTGITNTINTYDYRLVPGPSGPASYVVHFKAWSSAGACQVSDVNISVSGPAATTTVADVNYSGNASSWNPGTCGTAPYSPAPNNSWYWVWDNGTAPCTLGGNNTNTYLAPSGSPNTIDGKARLFYLTWQDQNYGTPNVPQDPSERYSIDYQQGAKTADYFVYDTYLYMTDPQNLYAVQLDTNWVNPSKNVTVLGFLCVNNGPSDSTWEFTTVNSSGNTIWNDPTLHSPGWTQAPCNPQKWTTSSTPNGWHHVQLAGHRFQCSSTDTLGTCVNYDAITVDGNTTFLTNWYGYSTFTGPWNAGDVVLNFQLYGIPNNGNQASATVYTDGMTMINWTQPLSTSR